MINHVYYFDIFLKIIAENEMPIMPSRNFSYAQIIIQYTQPLFHHC